MLKPTLKSLLRLLPRTPAFDFLHTLIFFVYAHGRFPRRDSGLLNDYFFFLKNSPDMASPLRRVTSDKVDAKPVIDQMVGKQVTPQTHAVFTSVDDIVRSALPERCILKPAHGTGSVVLLEGAAAEITGADRDRLRLALANDLYRESREINYKDLPKRIICEELIELSASSKDYKLFFYRGKLRFIQVDSGRHGVHKQNFYDAEWNRIFVTYNNNPTGEWEDMPEQFPAICEAAGKIAAHFESVRVDLYLKGTSFYVGEITHCHNQANGVFASIEQEREISRLFFGEENAG